MSDNKKRTADEAGLNGRIHNHKLVQLASLNGLKNQNYDKRTVIVHKEIRIPGNERHTVTLVNFTEGKMREEKTISVKPECIDVWEGLLVFLTGLSKTELNGALCILGKYCPRTQRHRVQRIEFTPTGEFHYVGHELAVKALNLVKEVMITKEDNRHHGKRALVDKYNPQTKLYELSVQYPALWDIAPYKEDVIINVSLEDFMFQEWIMC